MINLPRNVEAEITLLPTEHGGRTSAVRSNYRPQFYYAGHDWDAVQTYPDDDEVRPGETARAYLGFLSPDAHVGRLEPGEMFLLREGNQAVGFGKITGLVDLESSANRAREQRTSQPFGYALHPYIRYEGDPLWAAIDGAIRDLSNNGDLALTTAEEYFIGYICQSVRTELRQR